MSKWAVDIEDPLFQRTRIRLGNACPGETLIISGRLSFKYTTNCRLFLLLTSQILIIYLCSSTPSFSLITLLELSSCPHLNDSSILPRLIHTLTAFDATGLTLSLHNSILIKQSSWMEVKSLNVASRLAPDPKKLIRVPMISIHINLGLLRSWMSDTILAFGNPPFFSLTTTDDFKTNQSTTMYLLHKFLETRSPPSSKINWYQGKGVKTKWLRLGGLEKLKGYEESAGMEEWLRGGDYGWMQMGWCRNRGRSIKDYSNQQPGCRC